MYIVKDNILPLKGLEQSDQKQSWFSKYSGGVCHVKFALCRLLLNWRFAFGVIDLISYGNEMC